MHETAARNRRFDQLLDALDEHAADVDLSECTAQEIRDLVRQLPKQDLADELGNAEAHALVLLWMHRRNPEGTLGAVLDAVASKAPEPPEDDA